MSIHTKIFRCIALSGLLLVLFAGCPPVETTETVPEVRGLTQTAAWVALTDAGLLMGTVEESFSDTVAPGLVMTQTPAPDEIVASASSVSVVLSLGVEPVTVPQVTGKTQTAAESDLTDAELSPSITQAYSDIISMGIVLSQEPAAGESVAPGTTVTIVISLGIEPATVPDVVGMTQSAAESAIASARLNVSGVEEYSDTHPEGSVFAQDPAAAETVVPGSTVTITISLGREPILLQDVVGMEQATAEAALIDDAFIPDVTLVYSDTVTPGRVISQTPAANTMVAPGTQVRLAVSVGPELPSALITEFVSANDTGLQDEDGEFVDWIEIYNPNVLPLNLLGYALTDDSALPGKWIFPDVTLPAQSYLIVFASGKDRVGAELHTSFKLSSDGEYLALFNNDSIPEALSEFSVEFPQQFVDLSYALHSDQTFWYFEVPTPGADNEVLGAIYNGYVAAPVMSQPRGFHDTTFSVSLSTPTPDATIRYTLDGTAVTASHGEVFSTPIPVTSNAVIRAKAYKDGMIPSTQQTCSYFIQLPAAQQARPTISIVADPQESLYEPNGIMAIVGGEYYPGGYFYVDQMLFETDPKWRVLTAGDYNNPMQRGREFERPTSFELIYPEDNSGFQIDCGLRVQGSNFHRPRYRRDPGADWTLPGQFGLGVYLASYNKFSFRVSFRDDYGASRLKYPLFPSGALESFDALIFRGGHNDGYNPFIHDELIRRLGIDTGQIQARGIIANLFINGDYKGYYNLVERLNEEFFQDWYASDTGWDIITQSEVREGDAVAWDQLIYLANNFDISTALRYTEIGQKMDLVNFVDYLLVQIYVGNEDWPDNNWVSARERSPESRFRFYLWDAEASFRDGNLNKTGFDNFPFGSYEAGEGLEGESGEISELYRALVTNADFRALVSTRAHLHFAPGGALSEENVLTHYQALKADMLPMRPDFNTSIEDTWIPNREAVVIDALRTRDLYID